MPLSNAQYDELLRSYDMKQQRARELMNERREKIYDAVPMLRELDAKAAEAGIRAAKRRISGKGYDPEALSKELSVISEEKKKYLAAAGFPENALDMQYECSKCMDTGFVDGRKCSCFLEAETRLLYDRFRLGKVLQKENFAHFSFDCYSDTITDEKTGLTARQHAQIAYEKALYTASHIGGEDSSLLIYGRTGLGKTFLTHCIAKEAIDRGMSSLYFSAGEFVSLMSDSFFGKGENAGFSDRTVMNADLLILDDLGTELTNSFVNSQLFRVINERIIKNRTTVISTNLTLEEFRENYSERIFSRVASHFKIVKLVGDDIRLRKKRTQGGTT